MAGILAALSPILKWILRRIGTQAIKWCLEHEALVVGIVVDVASLPVSGPEKRNVAFDRIKEALVHLKADFTTNLINMAIEWFVAELRGKGEIK